MMDVDVGMCEPNHLGDMFVLNFILDHSFC